MTNPASTSTPDHQSTAADIVRGYTARLTLRSNRLTNDNSPLYVKDTAKANIGHFAGYNSGFNTSAHRAREGWMAETPQQYTKRILSHSEGKDAVKVQKATPVKLKSLTRKLKKAQLTKRPAPGKWSIAEIIAHLADAELVVSFRMRLMLGSNGTPIQAFDQDVWASLFDYASHDPAVSLEGYRVGRERNLRMFKSLTPEMWERFGMHSERGRETVRRVCEMMAGHDLNHLKQIRAILGK